MDNSQNPIVWQELNYLKRRSPRRMLWLKIIGPLIILLAIGGVAYTLTWIDFPTRETGIFAIWIVQIITAVYALNAGAHAISREHSALTWDALILTGVSVPQILFGKWRAVLRYSSPWMVILGIVRLAMIPIFMVALLNYYANIVYNYGGVSSGYSGYGPVYDTVPITWIPWATILAVVMTVVLTILDVMVCTAIGLAAGAIARNGVVAVIAAFLVRFTPVIIFAALTRYELGPMSSYSYTVLRFAPFGIADGGTSPLSRLSVPYTPVSLNTHADALLGLLMATGVLAGLLIAALVVAWIAIQRTGALPRDEPDDLIQASASE